MATITKAMMNSIVWSITKGAFVGAGCCLAWFYFSAAQTNYKICGPACATEAEILLFLAIVTGGCAVVSAVIFLIIDLVLQAAQRAGAQLL